MCTDIADGKQRSALRETKRLWHLPEGWFFKRIPRVLCNAENFEGRRSSKSEIEIEDDSR